MLVEGRTFNVCPGAKLRLGAMYILTKLSVKSNINVANEPVGGESVDVIGSSTDRELGENIEGKTNEEKRITPVPVVVKVTSCVTNAEMLPFASRINVK